MSLHALKRVSGGRTETLVPGVEWDDWQEILLPNGEVVVALRGHRKGTPKAGRGDDRWMDRVMQAHQLDRELEAVLTCTCADD